MFARSGGICKRGKENRRGERGGVDGVSGGEEVKGKASLTEVAELNRWPITASE
jgi:hypothetical protein